MAESFRGLSNDFSKKKKVKRIGSIVDVPAGKAMLVRCFCDDSSIRSKPSHIRQNLLITLIHAERPERSTITKDIIKDRLLNLYPQTKIIIIASEPHKKGGFHFHVGVLTTVSRHGSVEKLRASFPEWEGKAIDLKLVFHRGWPVICYYVTKEDNNFLVWGATRAQILEQAFLHKNHRRRKPLIEDERGRTDQREGRPSNKQKRKPSVSCSPWRKNSFFFTFFVKLLFGAFVLALFRDSENAESFVKGLSAFLNELWEYFFPTPPEKPEPGLLDKIRSIFFPPPPPPPPEPTTLEK